MQRFNVITATFPVARMYHISLCFTVSLSRMGHSDARGQESDQSDVNDQPCQKDHCRPGTQASLGLRKWSSSLASEAKETLACYILPSIFTPWPDK